ILKYCKLFLSSVALFAGRKSVHRLSAMHTYALVFAVLMVVFTSSACEDDDSDPPMPPGPGEEMIEGPNVATPYTLEIASFMPRPPEANMIELTEEGIELGRRLFYDPLMSRDNSISCASCHRQELAFTDGRRLSPGVRGLPGMRNAMSLVNLIYNVEGFFWDGSSPTLADQAIHPIEDVLEFDNDWPTVVERIRASEDYPKRFRAAFGIDFKSEITRELVTNAIAQFESTIISDNTRFDQYNYLNEGFPTPEETDGAELFFIEFAQAGQLHPGCSHCHNKPSFGSNRFFNTGLDTVATLNDFPDLGRGGETGNIFENGMFRAPTLRNISLTAPYMHDGRFNTLEEVLDHYASGGHPTENRDPNITGFPLTQQQKEALIAFMESLVDEELITDERFSNPFEE
ncbi:MAG: cytochrome c peroxidase, partial [Bacteroidota bacterium]